jgi:heptosyltransferase-2
VLREDVPCAPCKLRACPVDHACMVRLRAERVGEAALGLVSEC